MARLTGQRARSTLPRPDTPRSKNSCVPCSSMRSDAAIAAQSAREAWAITAAALAGTAHVRISKDGGKSYPARHARPLPDEPPDQPCTIPVFDPASATGRMLVLDLDPSRGDVSHQAAGLGQLLERLGARYVADVATSTGGRHILIPFAVALPWLELRDLCRAMALRFPSIDGVSVRLLSPGTRGCVEPGSGVPSAGWWRIFDECRERADRARPVLIRIRRVCGGWWPPYLRESRTPCGACAG